MSRDSERKFFILMSHKMTESQKRDAISSFGVTQFIEVPNRWWGQIPPNADSIVSYIEDILNFLEKRSEKGDIILVQGDFGATFYIACWAKKHDLLPVYATTERVAIESVDGEKIITTREFKHVRFRVYETEKEI